jgi:hypothetical protein
MATLHNRNGIWYISYRWAGKQYRLSTKTRDKKMASFKLKELEVKLFRGEHEPAKHSQQDNTIAGFFRRYIEFSQATKSAATNLSDLYRIKQIQEYFARKRLKYLEEITPGQIQLFQTFILSDHNARTYNNFLNLLKSILNKAVEWGILKSNPIKNCKPLKIPKKIRCFHLRR